MQKGILQIEELLFRFPTRGPESFINIPLVSYRNLKFGSNLTNLIFRCDIFLPGTHGSKDAGEDITSDKYSGTALKF